MIQTGINAGNGGLNCQSQRTMKRVKRTRNHAGRCPAFSTIRPNHIISVYGYMAKVKIRLKLGKQTLT
jgi:hypothetical protein